MKNLWTVLPPLLADNFGFLEAVNDSDGCGIIDDSGEFRLGGGHGDSGGREGHDRPNGRGIRGGRDWASREGISSWSREGRDVCGYEREGRSHERTGRAHGGKHGGSGRVTVSGASSEDVITGTRSRILDAFAEVRSRLDPKFVLFSAGPCGAMIGTDLEEIAETVTREWGLPAAAVNLTGQKSYDIGLSRTLEAMARLLAKPMSREEGP